MYMYLQHVQRCSSIKKLYTSVVHEHSLKETNNVKYYCICLSNVIKEWKLTVRKAFLKLSEDSRLTIFWGPFQVETTLLKKKCCPILIGLLDQWLLSFTPSLATALTQSLWSVISSIITSIYCRSSPSHRPVAIARYNPSPVTRVARMFHTSPFCRNIASSNFSLSSVNERG